MRCPACQSNNTKVVKTVPGEQLPHGHEYRTRKCNGCQLTFMTYEIEASLYKRMHTSTTAAEEGALVPIGAGGPLPTMPRGDLTDIEVEMEGLLERAFPALMDVLQARLPNKTKFDAARWIIEDRRQHRRALAERVSTTGDTTSTASADPAVSQLVAILEQLKNEEVED